MSELIQQLKELMQILGETDYSLQSKTKISQSTIYRILEGKTSDPGVHKIDGLAHALGYKLSLVPLSEPVTSPYQADELEALRRVITLVETLAASRGVDLSPQEKAELIISNYKATNQKPKLTEKIVNLK